MNKPLIAVSLLALIAVGCEEKKPAAPTAPTAPKTGASLPALPDTKTTADITADAKEKTAAALSASLDAAKAQLDDLGTRIKAAAEDKKPAMQAAWNSLKEQYDGLTTKLAEIKNSPKWQEMASEARTKVDALKTSIADTVAKWAK